jgi:hypothetical protein
MAPVPQRPSLLRDRYSPEAAAARAYLGLNPREQLREQVMDFVCVNGVAGDWLEFGAYRGDGIIHAYWAMSSWVHHNQPRTDLARVWPSMEGRRAFQAAQRAIQGMRFVAFDSFAGLPEPTNAEQDLFARGDYACTRADMEANLRANHVDMSRVVVVEGFFEDTLNKGTCAQHSLSRAAVVHVDCDLFEPAAAVLEFVVPLLGDGTVILFDDWDLYRGHPDRGEQGAFHQWRARHPDIRLSPFKSNNAFVIHVD